MTLADIRADFALLDDWEDRYRFIIELGRELPPLPSELKTEANKVRGCVSQVWLVSEVVDRDAGRCSPILKFRGDSDAHIVRGLIALLFALYQGKSAQDILAIDPAYVGAHVDLALHAVRSLVESDFDISYASALPKQRGEGHAFGFVHRRLMARRVVPIVPVVVNTYYPPNQPRPGRCFRLGRALRSAIESFPEDRRIGVLASGGLSHFTIDEALDRAVLEACRNADEQALSSLPLAKLNSGNSEIRNWIVAAGAAAGLQMLWHEYVPLYRTAAGTGCAMAFAAWREKR